MQRSFLPFAELAHQPALVVDSLYPNLPTFSHWRGAPTPEAVRDDTSGGCVLRALTRTPELLRLPYVTANHFDIDGFVGVWSLLHPEAALAAQDRLLDMARIGDFRELNLDRPAARAALPLVCWINERETALFYPPFAAGGREAVASVPKFTFFNEAFEEVLRQPEMFRDHWGPEHDTVLQDAALVRQHADAIVRYPELGLVVLRLPRPVHYYALFGVTEGFDMVLAQYPDQRYELEYKYTTWIDLASRPTLPRLHLQPLVERLNALERGPLPWHAEPITDTGPILRLDARSLPKPQRYGHPTERPIHTSSIPPHELEQQVVAYFREYYAGVQARWRWTWHEIRTLNQQIFGKKADRGALPKA
ncbi:hypothetical protein SAMN05421823_101635 [Catalinimonas alkaloidigena]|uniref:Uncharacterized protein n=1 Tax=Catalinimonas alkaloidigena TaxID=1075417 RepID=A0A1G8YCZ9_9BACT|nr:DUF6687 family protein [Catalinimonas alkaloidigena]SDK00601.1 hypothetical protein SAMN05421823_101635 [Catalinimonas alkaloidigena]